MATVVSLNATRKQKSNRRVFQALECIYAEALNHLTDAKGRIDPADWEAFMIQMLGEYLTSTPDNQPEAVKPLEVAEKYQQFDLSLRQCLHHKLKVLHHFEQVSVRS